MQSDLILLVNDTCRYSEVKSRQLSWAGQYKICVQYDFKFTSEYMVDSKDYGKLTLVNLHKDYMVNRPNVNWPKI